MADDVRRWILLKATYTTCLISLYVSSTYLHLSNDVHAFNDLSKYDVFTIQPATHAQFHNEIISRYKRFTIATQVTAEFFSYSYHSNLLTITNSLSAITPQHLR